MTIPDLTTRDLKELVRSCLETGESTSQCEILHTRGRGRGMLLRISDQSTDSTVIVKAWRAQTIRDHIKRILGLSNARREWRAHKHVERAGLAVPKPLHFFQLKSNQGHWFEVAVIEDLGSTTNGMVFLKDLVQRGEDEAIHRFEDQVLEMTGRLIGAKIIDDDHQLRNIVVNGSDRPTRIDFECARALHWREIPVEMYGRMLANMVCSHVHACQPQVYRSESFASRLVELLHPPSEVRQLAKLRIHQQLDRQKRSTGIDSSLRIDW